MTKRVTATELQRKTRQVIDEVRTSGRAVVVESHGKPMVAVIPFAEYERAQRERDEDFEKLFAWARANAELNKDLTEESAMELYDRIAKEIWDEDHGIKR